MLSMLKSIHRRALGIDKDDKILAPSGFAAGGDGKPSLIFPSPDTVAVFDDFLVNTLMGAPTGIGVTDTGLAPNTITDTGIAGVSMRVRKNVTTWTNTIVNVTNGVFRITAVGNGGTPAANNGGIFTPKLSWKANQGPGGQSGRLRFGVRMKCDVWTHANSLFMGFCDDVADHDTGTKEMPMYDTGGAAALFAVNSDACGFLFGNNADTGWRGVSARGTAGDSGEQQVTLTTTAPTANVYRTYEVEIQRGNSDTAGTATFYIDGTPLGSITSPLATSAQLGACVVLSDTGGRTVLDIDWINISAPRDTGE